LGTGYDYRNEIWYRSAKVGAIMTEQTGDWILRIEGVNFVETVFNTTDLSTIRGASLTLEAIGYEIEAWFAVSKIVPKPERVYIGGSQAVFKLPGYTATTAHQRADDLRKYLAAPINFPSDWPAFVEPKKLANFGQFRPDEQLRFLETPSEHMTFVVDVEEIASGDAKAQLKIAINKAHMRSRRRQMRAPNLPRSPGARAKSGLLADRARLRCPIDPDRQIADDPSDKGSTLVVGKDQFGGSIEYLDPTTGQPPRLTTGVKRICVSKRVADLRPYGRDARRTLYPVQIGPDEYRKLNAKGLFDTHDFARSFDDILANPPAGLAPSVRGKLAYVYLDGNKFSTIRDASDFVKFAEMVDSIKKEMLTTLLTHFLDRSPGGAVNDIYCRERNIYTRTSREKWGSDQRQLMRVETLILGGEDACLVVPAWLAFEITELLLQVAQDTGNRLVPTLGAGTPTPEVSFRAGVLICDARTPARRAVAVADALCSDAKVAYKKAAGDKPTSCLSFHIAESQDLPEYTGSTETMMAELRGPKFSVGDQKATNAAFRAILPDWQRQAGDLIELKSTFARSQLYRLIDELESFPRDTTDERHKRFDKFVRTYMNRARTAFDGEKLRQKLPCGHDVPLVLRLKILAELWDYVDPFGSKATTLEDVK